MPPGAARARELCFLERRCGMPRRLPLLLCLLLGLALCEAQECGPGTKRAADGTGKCVSLSNADVFRSINWLATPPSQTCKNLATYHDITICEDDIKVGECTVWSVITTDYCDDVGALDFEKLMSQKCDVVIYHFTHFFKGNTCTIGSTVEGYPRITITRTDVWAKKCYHCLYSAIDAKALLAAGKRVDVLKIQQKSGEGVDESEFDGTQFTLLSDFFLHSYELSAVLQQISVVVSVNANSLQDFVGREAEHAWNMWGSQRFLRGFAAVHTRQDPGPFHLQPMQFKDVLSQARVDPAISFYRHTFKRVGDPGIVEDNERQLAAFEPAAAPVFKAQVPPYCHVPGAAADAKMQRWIAAELRSRCHPTRLWVPCEEQREYDAFVPCKQELMDNLADDYASSKGWCDFTSAAAAVPPLLRVDPRAAAAFQRAPRSVGVRLAFLFTVYSDAAFVNRLFGHLYSREHYYLLHVDPKGSSADFKAAMAELARGRANVFIADDVPIVYGASTATILLSKSMAWYDMHATGWDYLVAVTGSDYPLVPLSMIEKMLQHRKPAMPFVMAWTPGTSTHLFRLQKTHPVFEYDPLLRLSIQAVTDERGYLLGQVPMEFRSSNFGPPLFCEGRQSFYHLDNRRNKSGVRHDTQWLFPRDRIPGRGKAYSEEDRAAASPSFDGVFRVWKKSDPATTGFYDRETVKYFVASEEGKKYWHFFRHMLLGSEEHYYASLLYNYERTRAFVQTLSAEVAWNTWELGWWDKAAGFQTHTHFLTVAEWDILRGFAKRGMVFARKFSSKKTSRLLDMIDSYILNNKSTDAGAYWPDFFPTDTTTYGKTWITALRANKTIAKQARAMQLLYGPVPEESPKERKERLVRQQQRAQQHIEAEIREQQQQILAKQRARPAAAAAGSIDFVVEVAPMKAAPAKSVDEIQYVLHAPLVAVA